MDNPTKQRLPRPRAGVYLTEYGNACEVNIAEYGHFNAFDLDSQELIPIEMVDLTKRLRDLD